MEAVFSEEIKSIYRLKVPFERIYTSVFLIKAEENVFLVDCATTDYDVDNVILPALRELGVKITDINFLVLTHRHSDHAGGSKRILELAPDISVVTDIRTIDNGISTYSMSGHTEDCIGVLDERTHTLISGDGLQGAGVDRYRCSLKNKEAYVQTLETVKNDPRIENILFSHAYEPWNTDRIQGRENIRLCTIECNRYILGDKK